MWYHTIRYFAILAWVVLSFHACGKQDISENAARLRIQLTDASTPGIKELHFDISAIEVWVTDTASASGEWEPLDFKGGTYNLLSLMNGRTVQLVDQYFAAGKTVDQIKLVPGNNSHMMTVTAESIPLIIPPELADGIVIEHVNVTLSANIITSIVLDVNVALSVRESNGNFFLHPVARAFPETFGGKLRGYVTPVETVGVIAVVHEADTLITIPEADGMFMFTGLTPGDWEVHLLTHPEAGYRDTVLTETITTGQIREIVPKPIRLLPQ